MQPGRHRRTRRHPLLPLILVAVAAAGSAVLYAARPGVPDAPRIERLAPSPPSTPVVGVSNSEPEAIVTEWLARRSAAYADGDPEALAALYTPHTQRAGEDVAALRAYQQRGVALPALTYEVFSVRVLSRSPERWSLAIEGRTVPGPAVVAGESVQLPTPSPQCRRWILVKWQGGWRVAGIRAMPRCGA